MALHVQVSLMQLFSFAEIRHEIGVVRVSLHAIVFSRNGAIMQDVLARAADLELLRIAIISGNRGSGAILFG